MTTQGLRYPGGKMAAGCREQIIGAMPPHDLYVEPYLGGGAIFYAKRPAAFSVVADVDADLIRYHARQRQPNTAYLVADALRLLPSLALDRGGRALVYCDPPYVMATRTGGAIYRHEVTDEHHSSLLAMLQELPCYVMLSGYRNALYDDALRDWYRRDFTTMTRGGPRVESLWCNFEPGAAYHDLRYVGRGFRERERIKRKRARWEAKFRAMSAGERAVILEALTAAGIAESGDGRGIVTSGDR